MLLKNLAKLRNYAKKQNLFFSAKIKKFEKKKKKVQTKNLKFKHN
ncbi:hypothetical protein RB653_007692 [Dictyostelium firmibasis]|uniref:Uncharacterized protein n=1 Tax=Dictyostelium firmibasis TaxID=79012 RepID=A0AAN7TW17_9MYCE